MQRKENPHVLLVDWKIGTPSVGNSMEVPQKIKNKITIWASNYTSGYFSKKKTKTVIRKDICTPVFIEALFTVAKTGRNLMFTDRWTDKEDVGYLYIYIYIISYIYERGKVGLGNFLIFKHSASIIEEWQTEL